MNKVKEISIILFTDFTLLSITYKNVKISLTSCSFCQSLPKTISHLFWDCPFNPFGVILMSLIIQNVLHDFFFV